MMRGFMEESGANYSSISPLRAILMNTSVVMKLETPRGKAIAYAARTLKLVVEPGGAVALAAVMAGRIDARGRTIAVVLSGGNIDDALLREVLS